MDDPFKTISTAVSELKAEYEQLTVMVPKLKETKKAQSEELESLQREFVALQAQYDTLVKEIDSRTQAYNTWQTAELSTLDKQKADFKQEIRTRENEYVARETQLKEQAAAIDKRATAITADANKVVEDQKDIDTQRQTNASWASSLGEKEAALSADTQKLEELKQTLESKESELSQRESKLSTDEQELASTVKSSESDRSIARQMLEDAKDKVASNDTREAALTMQEQLIKGREQELRKLEAALNDRRDVMITNGTLPI